MWREESSKGDTVDILKVSLNTACGKHVGSVFQPMDRARDGSQDGTGSSQNKAEPSHNTAREISNI